MTAPDPAYPGQVRDSLLDRVTRLPFVIPGDPTGVPASVLLALAPVDGADDLEPAAARSIAARIAATLGVPTTNTAAAA